LDGNRQPFPKARHASLASSQFIASGKSFCDTNRVPILTGLPIISLASWAKQKIAISTRGKNNSFFIVVINLIKIYGIFSNQQISDIEVISQYCFALLINNRNTKSSLIIENIPLHAFKRWFFNPMQQLLVPIILLFNIIGIFYLSWGNLLGELFELLLFQ